MIVVTTKLLPVIGKFIFPVAVASVSLAANIAATKAMIEKGVERVDGRLEEKAGRMDEKLGRMDKKLGRIDEKLDRMEERTMIEDWMRFCEK